jgi:4'-phosphopantetheinyl transferase
LCPVPRNIAVERWPQPAAGEAHVWAVPLDVAPATLAALRGVLAPAEEVRAARLVGEEARTRFVAARGALRLVLAPYAGVEPAALGLRTADGGKPFLQPEAGIRFNLAHSGELAVVAVTAGVEVGIDLERRRAVDDAAGLAARYFGAAEARELAALPAGEQSDAFLRCWTRKEAVLKAAGTGVAGRLDSIRVTFGAEDPPVVLELGALEGGGPWSLHAFEPASGYVGALAVQAPACRMRRFTLCLDRGGDDQVPSEQSSSPMFPVTYWSGWSVPCTPGE